MTQLKRALAFPTTRGEHDSGYTLHGNSLTIRMPGWNGSTAQKRRRGSRRKKPSHMMSTN